MSEDNGGDAGQNGSLLSDPVDVIIDKLLRYDCCVPLRFWRIYVAQ